VNFKTNSKGGMHVGSIVGKDQYGCQVPGATPASEFSPGITACLRYSCLLPGSVFKDMWPVSLGFSLTYRVSQWSVCYLNRVPTGMLALKPFAEAHGRSMVQAQAIPPVRLLALRGFSTHQLAYMLDSLVRVTRRAGWKPSASILRAQFPKDEGALRLLSRPGGIDQVAIPAFVPPNQPMLTSARRVQRPARDACARAHPMASKRFPLNNFKYFLTLFSKFFSSFPQVLRRYRSLASI